MKRRDFIRFAGGAGATALFSGYFARGLGAEDRLARKLITEVQPYLAAKARREFLVLPPQATRNIRMWFSTKTFRVKTFVDEICSVSYRERLRAFRTREDRENALMVSFLSTVMTPEEIRSYVYSLADDLGHELDLGWEECCKSIGKAWDVHLREYPPSFTVDEFVERVERLVHKIFLDAVRDAGVATFIRTPSQLAGGIGRSALLVLPEASIRVWESPFGRFSSSNSLAIPTFIFLALEHVIQYIAGLLYDPRPSLQRVISSRVSTIGNKIASEFQSLLRQQLRGLHDWQERALDKAATEYAGLAVK